MCPTGVCVVMFFTASVCIVVVFLFFFSARAFIFWRVSGDHTFASLCSSFSNISLSFESGSENLSVKQNWYEVYLFICKDLQQNI